MDIARAITAIAAQYGMDRFTDGDCHTLAVALYEANGQQGHLSACLRLTRDEDGALYSTGYSHMVYVCPEGRAWDIGGDNADERWEDEFPDLGQPDKWGMTDEFVWVGVPYPEHQGWLMGHGGRLDNMLGNYLKSIIRSTERAPAHLV